MKELSVFIDESGDFGPYEYRSPYYIVTLVFHEQSVDISDSISHLNKKLQQFKLPETPLHAGPLIRREYEYDNYSLLERKRIFNLLYNFTRTTDFSYKCLVVEKKQLVDELDLHVQLSKQLSVFFKENVEFFTKFDNTTVYYDYGQRELTHVIVTNFSIHISNIRYKKALPADYKLVQAADMICTLELLAQKMERKALSNSEQTFFGSEKKLYKSYLRAIQKKQI